MRGSTYVTRTLAGKAMLAVAALAAPLALLAVPGAVPPAGAEIVPSGNAGDLARAIAGPGAIVTGASFPELAAPTANGVSDAAIGPSFPTDGDEHAILTTGSVEAVDDPNGNPDDQPDGVDDFSVDLGGPNRRGDTDFDVSVLRIDLLVPPTANCLSFDFQFFSEEYDEYVGTAYNDAFIAELDASTWSTSGSTISAPRNFAFDGAGHEISVNAVGTGGSSIDNAVGTTYDGATPLLSAATEVEPGTRALYLSVFDQGDHVLDSAVFADNLRVGFVDDPGVSCRPGAVPKQFQLDLDPATASHPAGETHTVTATLQDLSASPPAVSGGSIRFTTAGVNATSGVAVTDADGHASYTFTGTNPGTDAISACYDADVSGACDADEPVGSATVTWKGPPLDGPRIAFTTDKDRLHRVDLERDVDGANVFFTSSDRRPYDGFASIPPATVHQGEATRARLYRPVYISTDQEPHGEVYREVEGARVRMTCDTSTETHPVRDNDTGAIAYASDAGGDWDIYVATPPPPPPPRRPPVGWAVKPSVGTTVGTTTASGPAATSCDDWVHTLVTVDDAAPADDLWPTWTAGGGLIFSSTREDPLGDLYAARPDEGTWAVTRLTDTPGVAESQPSATELATGVPIDECPGPFGCAPTTACENDQTTESWVAFTTTEFRPDGSIGLLSLDRPDLGRLNGFGAGSTPQASEPVWSGCPEDAYLAWTTTRADPYGDIWVGSIQKLEPADDPSPAVLPEILNDAAVAAAPGVAESHPAWDDIFQPIDPGGDDVDPPDDDTGRLLFTSRTVDPSYFADSDDASIDADIDDVVAASGLDRRTIIANTETDGDVQFHPFDEAGPAYSPDGSRVAYSADPIFNDEDEGLGRRLMVANADGSDPQPLLPDGLRNQFDVDVDPVWSPDGTKVAFTRYRYDAPPLGDPSYAESEVWVADLAAGTAFSVTQQPELGQHFDIDPSWSPDGRHLVVARVVESPIDFAGGGTAAPAGAVRTSRAAPYTYPTSRRHLWVLDATGSGAAAELFTLFNCGGDGCRRDVRGRSPAWSPDGTTIAYDNHGALRLVTVDPGGPTAEELAAGEWRIDGYSAVTGFADSEEDPFGQGGAPTPSRPVIAVAEDPAWSPDMSEIAFAGQPAGYPDQRGIWAIKPDGTGLRSVTDLHPEDPEKYADTRGPETEPTWQREPDADLQLKVAVTGSPAEVGDPLLVTWTLTNLGSDTAKDVKLATTYTAGGSPTGSTPPSGCAADGSGCTLPTLAGGASLTYKVQLTYGAALSGQADGTVTADTRDPVPTNNQASAPYDVVKTPPPPPRDDRADIAVSVSLDEPIGYVGGRRKLTFTVTNRGPDPAADVRLTAAYPKVVSEVGPTCIADGVPCLLGTFPAGTTKKFTVELRTTKAGAGEIFAVVKTTTKDPRLANNRDQIRLPVKQPTIRVLPSVARPGMVVLAYGENMPPGSRVTLVWDRGITIDRRPVRVGPDGKIRASLLVVRRDLLGARILEARSVTKEFSMVEGDLLVVLRLQSGTDLIGRG